MSTAIVVIVVIALYALGMGLFQVLGGLAAAAEALKRWGEASSTVRHARTSTSSHRACRGSQLSEHVGVDGGRFLELDKQGESPSERNAK